MKMSRKGVPWLGLVVAVLVAAVHNCLGNIYNRTVCVEDAESGGERSIDIHYVRLATEQTEKDSAWRKELGKQMDDAIEKVSTARPSYAEGEEDEKDVLCIVADIEEKGGKKQKKAGRTQIWRMIGKEEEEEHEGVLMFIEYFVSEKEHEGMRAATAAAKDLVRGIALGSGVTVKSDSGSKDENSRILEDERIYQITAAYESEGGKDKKGGLLAFLRRRNEKKGGSVVGVKVGLHVTDSRMQLGRIPIERGILSAVNEKGQVMNSMTFQEARVVAVKMEFGGVQDLRDEMDRLLRTVTRGLCDLPFEYDPDSQDYAVARWSLGRVIVTYKELRGVQVEVSAPGPHISLLHYTISTLCHYALHHVAEAAYRQQTLRNDDDSDSPTGAFDPPYLYYFQPLPKSTMKIRLQITPATNSFRSIPFHP